MWLLKHLNPMTGPFIMVGMVAIAVLIYFSARWLASSNAAKWVRRFAKIVGYSGLVVGILTTVLYVPFSMLSCIVFDRWLAVWHEEIKVQGIVIEKSSGKAVPDARITIHAAASVYLSHEQFDFATTSDENGEFSISTRLPKPCNQVYLFAASPNNHLARADWKDSTVVMQTTLVEDKWARRDRYRYNQFTGGSRSENITFHCDSWLLEGESPD